tara:strand:- start:8122 stop:9057 length:936 start_codon:yes stop_codon:yes gene_type:complete
MNWHPANTKRGSSLLAVFWLLAILSFAVFTSLNFVVGQVETQSTQKQAFRAEQMIERGLAIAAHPNVIEGSPLLTFESTDDFESLEVSLRSEAARFNLNTLLLNEERELLESIFGFWGLGMGETADLIDRLMDWVDGDDLVRASGAERDAYEEAGLIGLPFNRPFQTLDEVSQVRGMDAVSAQFPEWRDWFTLWSSTGQLDLNAAASPLIQVACGCSPIAADQFILSRNGPDGIPDTEDDLRFQTLDDVLSLLGATGLPPEQISSRLTFREPVKRVAIVALVGNYGARRDVVLTKGNGELRFHYWRDSVIP